MSFGFAVHISQWFSTIAYLLPFQNSDLVITHEEPHQTNEIKRWGNRAFFLAGYHLE